jgi:hypothetical protein
MGAAGTSLTGDQLQEVLGLLKGADSAELKLTVSESQQNGAVMRLGADPLDATVRQVYFFDSPHLTLHAAGIVARARRIQGAKADSVVKLRPVVPEELSPEIRRDPAFGVEVDAMPGGFVCSASLKGSSTNDAVREAAAGRRPIRKLFSKLQRRFLDAHAPESMSLDDLTVLGPINVLKLKYRPKGLARKLAAELWIYPDGSRILELSTKCSPNEAFQVAAESRAFLEGHGLDLSTQQQTKTATALRFFAEQTDAMPAV